MTARVARPPFRIQIAFDGDWMDAWRFGPDAVPSPTAVGETLAGRMADVAVEFCFEMSTGENFFFGQRRLGRREDPRTVDFVNGALACARGHDWVDVPEFLSRLGRVRSEVEQAGQVVFCVDPDNVEVGITDWWRRGQVVEVWNARSGIVPVLEDLRGRLLRHGSLHANDINFVCLEFNFHAPVHHWFGIEISRPENGRHVLRIPEAHAWPTRCLERP